MKKSLRLLFATIVMAVCVAAASTTSPKSILGAGPEEPACPPGGCLIGQ